jgi:hypothetical protein
MKQSLNVPEAEEPQAEISPTADAAIRELIQLFSDPALMRVSAAAPKGRIRSTFCLSQSSMTSSAMTRTAKYKSWVRHLYDLGLISRIPSEWEVPQALEGKSPSDHPPAKKRSTY